MADRPPACASTPRNDRVSVIIPCWNDHAALDTAIPALAALEGIAEIIVADASAHPWTTRVSGIPLHIVQCPQPSRGAQLNAGAARATGGTLLFHHADTTLTQPHVDALHSAIRDPAIVGGAFHRHHDDRHAGFRWLRHVTRAWVNLGGTLYGDQSIFVRHHTFHTMGRFAEIPLMEDVEFSRRLRRAGRIAVLDPAIATSPRHHEHRGAWRATFRNATLLALYHLGVPPARLHAIYYRGFRE